ncbi:MAG: hypothetical protein VST68_06885 [Nitrospirota bacterium]|nr:hypothetical protein [Nitrospirota bacterium]
MIPRKALLASAALSGLLIAAGCAHSHGSSGDGMYGEQMAKGQCHGVNDCKGHGECKGGGHSCEGKNDCKGKGWMSMSKADCDTKGGTYVAKAH